MSFEQVGEPLLSVLNQASRAYSQDKDETPLRDKEGSAQTVFTLGLNGLGARAAGLGCSEEQIAQVMAEASRQFAKGLAICESPIERMVLAALITAKWPPAWLTLPPLVHDAKVDERMPVGDLIIVPQMAFIRYRFDFGLICEWDGFRHIVAIECDGADFHKDAAKDRWRELFLASWGVPVFRFTGREIHQDPYHVVETIVGKVCDWSIEKLRDLRLPSLDMAQPRV